jgi:hypothetical protein
MGVLTFPAVALLDMWPEKTNWVKGMLKYLYIKYGKDI